VQEIGGLDIKRTGFMLKVREDRLDEYKRHHDAVWPEMLAALSRTGWHNYSLFMAGDGLLLGYFEAEESLEASLAAMEGEEINGRWQEMMAPFFEVPPGALPDQSMVELQEVFHLD
jgi:L-rhamnose mutarotase